MDDVLLVERTFRNGGVKNPLQVLRNGQDAIAYLAGEGEYSDRVRHPLPALVLLDLSLPGVDGFQVLRWIRRRFRPSDLRVIVLTGSVNLDDARRAYELGADSFLMKPLEFENAAEIGACLRDNWLEEVGEGPGAVPPAPLPGDDSGLGEVAA